MNEYFTTKPSTVLSDRVLYTPSAFARNSLLYLQETGTLQALKPHTCSRAKLDSYLFFTVISGSGLLVYNGKEYSLTPGSCVFINCYQPYCHSTDLELWKISWCHFNGPIMGSVYDKYVERGGRPVFIPDFVEPFISTIEDLMNKARSSDYIRDMIINEKLSTLIRLIMSYSWHPEDKKVTPKRTSVEKVKYYLDLHYTEKVSLDELSEMFFIDKYYLAKTFKNQFGFPISTYIQNIRITKAKQLLRFSEKTVEEIGYEVGMDNPAYFSRVFKNVEGVSPKTYREQW